MRLTTEPPVRIASKACPEIKTTPMGLLLFLAGPTGFEPAISSVTGRRDRPASLRAHGYQTLVIIADAASGATGYSGFRFNYENCYNTMQYLLKTLRRCSSAGRAALS